MRAASAGLIAITCTRAASAAGNDRLSDAEALGTDPRLSAVSGTTTGATITGDETGFFPGVPIAGYGSVWFTWSPPAASQAHMVLNAQPGNMAWVFEPAPGGGLEAVTADATDSDQTAWVFESDPAVTYTIAVTGPSAPPAAGDFSLALATVSPHANDNFSDRLPLDAGAPVTIRASPFQATRETRIDPPAHGAGGTLWWEISPGHTSRFALQATPLVNSGEDFHVELFRERIDPLTRLFAAAPKTDFPGRFVLQPGDTYFVRLSGSHTSAQVIEILLVPFPATPTNDFLSNRLPVGEPGGWGLGGLMAGATSEPGEPEAGRESVWYEWVPERPGIYRFSILENTSVGFELYTGSSIAGLTQIAPESREAVVDLEGGQPVQIAAVSRGFGDPGHDVSSSKFRLWFGRLSDVPNDDRASAQRLRSRLPASASGDASAATTSGDDPMLLGEPAEHSLWWEWTAETAGPVTAYTVGSDALIGVFEAAAPLPPIGIELAAGQQRTTFDAVAGRRYLLMTARGDGDDSYSVHLAAAGSATPSNDAFADAIPLTTGSTVRGDNALATLEEGETIPVGHHGAAGSLWYRWTAPNRGTLTLRMLDGDRSTRFAIFTGNSIEDLAFGQKSYRGTLHYAVSAGTTYHIAIHEPRAGQAGAFRFETGFISPSPANDLFSDATDFGTLLAPVEFVADLEGGSLEASEPLPGQPGEAGTLWWKFAVPERQFVKLETLTPPGPSSSGLRSIGFLRGSSVDRLEPVLSYNIDNSRVVAPPAAGQPIHIRTHVTSAPNGQAQFRLTPLPPPPNDSFATPIDLGTTETATARVEFPYATFEAAVEPDVFSGRGSVWWRWTAPRSGTAVVSTDVPPELAGPIKVYPETGAPPLPSPLLETWTLPNTFEAEAGSTYILRAETEIGLPAGVSYQVNISLPERPANDRFSGRYRLPQSEDVRIEGTFAGAIPNPGSEPTVWYAWSPPRDGAYHFRLLEPTLGAVPRIDLYSGTDEASLTYVQQHNTLVAGQDYSIKLTERFPVPFTLEISPASLPAHDSFDAAIALEGDRFVIASPGELATMEPREPRRAAAAWNRDAATSLWWKWRAEWSGFVLVEPGSGSLAIYQGGPEIENLKPVPTTYLLWAPYGSDNWDGGGVVSPVAFRAERSTEYYFAVLDDNPLMRPFEFTFAASPENDDFANRTFLPSDEHVTWIFDIGAATAETNEPEQPGFEWTSLWWGWVAPTTGEYSVTRDPPGLIAVFAGNTLTDLARIDSGSTFHAIEGHEYQLRASSRVPSATNREPVTTSLLLERRSPYADWADQSLNGLGAETRDPAFDADGDGAANLIEMAYRTDPTDTASAPPPWFASADPSTGKLQLHYARPNHLGLFAFTYETSTDGVRWVTQPVGSTVTESSTPIDAATDLVTATFDAATDPEVLARLRITLLQ